METILSHFYDCAYDPDLWFSQSHKRSYDSAYDPVSDSGCLLQFGQVLLKNHEGYLFWETCKFIRSLPKSNKF